MLEQPLPHSPSAQTSVPPGAASPPSTTSGECDQLDPLRDQPCADLPLLHGLFARGEARTLTVRSGGVFAQTLPDGSRVCMLNPAHPRRRNKITLMEEISHCFLGHQPTKLVAQNSGRVRDYEMAQEEEAFGIGAAVLLPWNLFFGRINSGRPIEELAEDFEVSQELVHYRIKICGATQLYKSRNGRG